MSRGALPRLAIALAALTGVGLALVGFSIAARGDERRMALRMHGQASWLPGEKQAASFTLRDQDGLRVALAGPRDRPLLLTFLDSQCVDQCPVEGRMLGDMLRQMPAAERPAVMIVSVNPEGDTPASIRHAMTSWRLAGPWEWHWLRGTKDELVHVWRAYGITVEPTSNDVTHGMSLHLIDRRGDERAGYLFPLLPNFVALDLRALVREPA